MSKGMSVEVLSGPFTNYVDADQLTWVGEGAPEQYEPSNIRPGVEIVNHRAGAQYGKVAILTEGSESAAAFISTGTSGRNWPMASGAFVWSTDSRFRQMYPAPVPLHNRYEVPEGGGYMGGLE